MFPFLFLSFIGTDVTLTPVEKTMPKQRKLSYVGLSNAARYARYAWYLKPFTFRNEDICSAVCLLAQTVILCNGTQGAYLVKAHIRTSVAKGEFKQPMTAGYQHQSIFIDIYLDIRLALPLSNLTLKGEKKHIPPSVSVMS